MDQEERTGTLTGNARNRSLEAHYTRLVSTDIVSRAYRAFGSFDRPEHFTDHRHCCECAEHDETMRSRPLSEIGVAELGNPGWCPTVMFTEQAYGYAMPRLIELALVEKNFIFSY